MKKWIYYIMHTYNTSSSAIDDTRFTMTPSFSARHLSSVCPDNSISVSSPFQNIHDITLETNCNHVTSESRPFKLQVSFLHLFIYFCMDLCVSGSKSEQNLKSEFYEDYADKRN